MLRWVAWNQSHYAEHGHGLWAVILRATGECIGDGGRVPQQVDGVPVGKGAAHLTASKSRARQEATNQDLSSRAFLNSGGAFSLSLTMAAPIGGTLARPCHEHDEWPMPQKSRSSQNYGRAQPQACPGPANDG